MSGKRRGKESREKESLGKEIWFLNREVLVVHPREPFVEWVLSTDDEGLAEAEWVRNAVTSFLLPQFEDPEESVGTVRAMAPLMFEILLQDWVLDPEVWPKDRSWKTFQLWFSFERIEIAWDLVDGPLSSDPPEPEWGGDAAEA